MESVPMTLACSICLDVCGDSCPKPLGLTRCGHIFHTACIREWWQTLCSRGEFRHCPICKTEAFYDNLLEVFPTFRPDTRTHLHDDTDQKLREERMKSALLREKLDELKGRILLMKATFSATIEKLTASLEQKSHEAADWELQAQYANESLAMFTGFYEEQKIRADTLQQKCEQLHCALVNRTKALFERPNRRNLPGRVRADQNAPDARDEDSC